MENQQEKNGEVVKWVQNIMLGLVSTAILGVYSKLSDLNDRMIRIEERAIVNAENITNVQASINRMSIEQMKTSDRVTRLEYQITNTK